MLGTMCDETQAAVGLTACLEKTTHLNTAAWWWKLTLTSSKTPHGWLGGDSDLEAVQKKRNTSRWVFLLRLMPWLLVNEGFGREQLSPLSSTAYCH